MNTRTLKTFKPCTGNIYLCCQKVNPLIDMFPAFLYFKFVLYCYYEYVGYDWIHTSSRPVVLLKKTPVVIHVQYLHQYYSIQMCCRD